MINPGMALTTTNVGPWPKPEHRDNEAEVRQNGGHQALPVVLRVQGIMGPRGDA